MTKEEREKVIGYYTEDENIYCVECVKRNIEIMKKVDQAITADLPEESLLVCDGCGKKFKTT